jgi:hypothetical protein
MEGILWPTQTAAQVVQVAGWVQQVDPEVFPVGSKPKTLLICPENPGLPFLIPKHRYIFKTALGWRKQQLWSEVIAYELSKLCGIDVPPCFAAFDARTGQAGVLMEFFYGYPDEAQTIRFVHGTDIIQGVGGVSYDPSAGRPHDVQGNIAVCRAYKVSNPRRWWAKTLTFDALIGNTDRHAENWGLLRGAPDRAVPEWQMAPPFDHGTSMGYEIREDDLERNSEAAAINRHLERGRHHCTWEPSKEKHGDPLFALCSRLCETYPHVKEAIGRLIPTPDAPFGEMISRWVEFDLPIKFSAKRATFVERLLRARRDALVEKLRL